MFRLKRKFTTDRIVGIQDALFNRWSSHHCCVCVALPFIHPCISQLSWYPHLSFKCCLRVDFATREEVPCGIIVSASRQPNRTCFLAQAPTGAKSIGIYVSLGRRKANETLTIGVNLTVDPFLALRFPFGPFQCFPFPSFYFVFQKEGRLLIYAEHTVLMQL